MAVQTESLALEVELAGEQPQLVRIAPTGGTHILMCLRAAQISRHAMGSAVHFLIGRPTELEKSIQGLFGTSLAVW